MSEPTPPRRGIDGARVVVEGHRGAVCAARAD
jgi:hypothetical protein